MEMTKSTERNEMKTRTRRSLASFPPLRAPGLQCALSLSLKGYFDETKKVRAPVSPLSGARCPPVGLPLASLDCQVIRLPAAPCFSLLQGLSTKLLAVGEYSAAGGGYCAGAEKSGGPATDSRRNKLKSNSSLYKSVCPPTKLGKRPQTTPKSHQDSDCSLSSCCSSCQTREHMFSSQRSAAGSRLSAAGA